MRRTKLVLAAVALMVATVVAFSAPAMADEGNHHAKNDKGNHHAKNDKGNHNNNRHNDFFDHRRNDADIFFVSDFGFDDDFDFDDDHFRFNHFGFNNFGFLGCWEWSWVFDRWEWECD